MLLSFVLLPATGYEIDFIIPFDSLSHINYREGLHGIILRHIISWSVQLPCSLIPPHDTLIALR